MEAAQARRLSVEEKKIKEKYVHFLEDKITKFRRLETLPLSKVLSTITATKLNTGK